MPVRDVELLLRIQAGDEEAFRELMDRYSSAILGFFYRLGLSAADAEDGVQEVFYRLYRSREEYVPRTKFRYYIFRVATNLWIDKVRTRKRRPGSVSIDASLDRDAGRPLSMKDQLTGRVRSPEAIIANRELGRRIEEAILKLPERQRIVFLLGERGGVKYSEIGKILGIPVGTVKSRMHSAVHQLRDLLKGEQAGNEA